MKLKLKHFELMYEKMRDVWTSPRFAIKYLTKDELSRLLSVAKEASTDHERFMKEISDHINQEG